MFVIQISFRFFLKSNGVWLKISELKKKKSMDDVMERFFKHTHFLHIRFKVFRKRADVPLIRIPSAVPRKRPFITDLSWNYIPIHLFIRELCREIEKSATRNELFKIRVIERGIWREVWTMSIARRRMGSRGNIKLRN